MSTDRHNVEVDRLVRFVAEDPVVAAVSREASGHSLYLVGGSVRDLLVGRQPAELDFVVEGPVDVIARNLDPDATVFERFGTAEIVVGGTKVDLATARRESYPEPGALPVVEPADLESDLARRDFTVNAIAIQVGGPGEAIDPFDGIPDLRSGSLRWLHEASFSDDPTRAFRAARYCARLDLIPDEATREGLERTDLSTISKERVDREIELLAAEEDPAAGLALLASWGILEIDPDLIGLVRETLRIIGDARWAGFCSREHALRALLDGETIERARALVPEPKDSWSGFRAVRSAPEAAVLIARADGAAWLDRWPDEWSRLELRITGDDLVEAGVAEGPAVGAGLDAALRDRVLNGDGGREREMSVALEQSRGHG